MVNRKKRLQKGIDSIEKQIELHEEKLRKAQEDDNIELLQYYRKELVAKKRDKHEEITSLFFDVYDRHFNHVSDEIFISSINNK